MASRSSVLPRFLMMASLLTACAGGHAASPATPAGPAPVAPAAPTTLGPAISQAELDARLADGRLHPVTDTLGRLEDGPQAMPFGDTPWLTVEGAVISVLACRPGGALPVFVADAAGHVYAYTVSSKLSAPPPSGGGAPSAAMATPSTYCSYQRFQLGAGQVWSGPLEITR